MNKIYLQLNSIAERRAFRPVYSYNKSQQDLTSNSTESVAPPTRGNNLRVEITLPLHMTATYNHCPLPENLKPHAFPPLPNKASALSAASPPDENTLVPDLATSGGEKVTNGPETAAASSPETE